MTVHPLVMFALVAAAFVVGAVCWGRGTPPVDTSWGPQSVAELEARERACVIWETNQARATTRSPHCVECVRRMSALQHCETELAELRAAIDELPDGDAA